MVRFPFEEVFLARTKLSYVNLPGLLADGKRDRSGRVDGFVVVERGPSCELIFLRDGNPFQAGIIRGDERRSVPLETLIEEIEERSSQGEEGRVGYFGAPRDQLRMMLSTMLADPKSLIDEFDALPGRHLFPALRENRVTGVVEVTTHPCTFHYLCFDGGGFSAAHLADDRRGGSIGERVKGVFEAEPPPRVRVFPLLSELPDQIPASLVRTYGGFIADLLDSLALQIGVPGAEEAVRDGRTRASTQHPLLERVQHGWEPDEWIARHTPEELREAVSAWVIETIALAGERADFDPTEHIRDAAGDRRFILREQGFFRSLPWPVPV